MKTKFIITACVCLIPVTFSLRALGQNYAIDWYKVAGGGGASTGGVYSVSGTIGQHDAGGAMVGGGYSLTGGFWALYVVQTPDAPRLAITAAAPGFAKISWSPAGPGWILQESPSLTAATWTSSSSTTNNPITVPVTAAAKFYRLQKL